MKFIKKVGDSYWELEIKKTQCHTMSWSTFVGGGGDGKQFIK